MILFFIIYCLLTITQIKIEEKANTPQAADDDTAVMGKTGDIEGREPSIVVVETIKDHQKAIASVRWALGGSMLATCSSDQFVHLYTVIE